MAYREDFQKALDELVGSGRVSRRTPVEDLEAYRRSIQPSPPSPNNSGAGLVLTDLSALGTSKPKDVNNDPWWRDVLNGLQGVGGIATNQMANWTDGDLKLNDFLITDTLKGAWEGQKEAWTDGELSFRDIPGFGALVGAGKANKTTDDVLNNLGWKEKEANSEAGWNPLDSRKGNFDIHDIVSFAGDVVFDPTTWATLGGASATKAGLRAATEAAAAQGVKGSGKSLNGIADQVYDSIFQKEAAKYGADKAAVRTELDKMFKPKQTVNRTDGGLNADLIERLAKRKAERAFNKVDNAGKTARANSQNALINFDIPFTSKGVASFGNKPGWLKINDSIIGRTGAGAVIETLNRLGLDDNQQSKLLKDAYGVDNAEEMTSQMIQHLNKNISKVSKGSNVPDAKVTEEIQKYFTNIEPYTAYRYQPNTSNIPTRGELPSGSGALSNRVGEVLDASPVTRFKPSETVFESTKRAEILPGNQSVKTMKNAQDTFSVNKFAQDMGGTSRAGDFISRKLKAINPRTLGAADNFVDRGAGQIRDTEGRIRGNTAQMTRDVKRFEDLAKGLNENDLNKVPYILEGKAPKGQKMDEYLKDVSNKDQLMKVVDAMRSLFHRFAESEREAGALKSSIRGYFPHVLNKKAMSSEELTKMLNDPEFQRLMGRNSANRFDKSRKSFDSFAEWDDAIAKMEESISKLTDADEIEEATKKLDKLRNLFERDAMKAMTERYRENVRKVAMADLYNTFKQEGTIIPGNAPVRNANAMSDMVKIDQEVAKRTGLKQGDFIHKDVLKGLERVETIFTDTGMQKMLENLTSATNVWKTIVTTLVPSHHYYNLVGNVANNSMVGVTPGAYKKSGELLNKMRKGNLSATEEKFIQEAYDNGILATGSMVDTNDPLRLAKVESQGKMGQVEDFVGNNRVTKGMRKVGDVVDDFSRLAHYIQIRKRTGSKELAKESVRKYLYNYGEATSTDRAIKVVMPFWTWTKNNVPRQIMEFARQPRYYDSYTKLQESVADDRDESLNPEYVNDAFHVPWSESTYYNPRLPLADLSNVGSMGKTGDTFMNSLSPALKIPAEMKTNQKFFNGAPIDPYKTEDESYSGEALANYFLQQTGIGNKAAQFGSTENNLLENIRNLFIGKPTEVDLNTQRKVRSFQQYEQNQMERKKRLDELREKGGQ